MHHNDFLLHAVFAKRVRPTLHWLAKSIEMGKGGSAAYYHLWRGWAPPYPETTGYIIETLFDYATYLQEEQWKNLAIHCTDWLCSIQRVDGAFPGGVGATGEPLIFDTGQILFGLTRTFRETGDVKYYTTCKKVVSWLVNVLETDGSWQRYSYTKGYIPSYYTRVVWGILYANILWQDAAITQQMQTALHYYINRITPQLSLQHWAFAPGEAAFTHTIAYTLRGMLESAHLLQDEAVLQQVYKILDQLIYIVQQNNDTLAGRYDAHWQGDYTFKCVTGHAQVSLLFARAYQMNQNPLYLHHAVNIFSKIVTKPYRIPIRGLYGAIPGSAPIWGAYLPFRFPNWAAKFYLDAYLKLMQLGDHKKGRHEDRTDPKINT
ncbi:MAG: hypothetical protein ACK4TA_07390 [Saprospiraceae bacterium]